MNNAPELTELTAISPLDGRYRKTTNVISDIFSEHGLQKRRTIAEVYWLLFLGCLLGFAKARETELKNKILQIGFGYSLEDTDRIKKIEKSLNHDVKAVEYLVRDIWTYISLDYFVQVPKAGEVGSSVMPHKVNPIDFENAEGNLEFAIATVEVFARKLLITRMQRDLSDSTFLRNLGLPFGHLLIAIKSTVRGLGKIKVNESKLLSDLDLNPGVLAEPIQTVMRACGVNNPYELLKSATRGKHVTLNDLRALVDDCKALTTNAKARLKSLTPQTYTGLASKLVDAYFKMAHH